MRRYLATVAVFIVLLASSASAAPSLVGTWRAHEMKTKGKTRSMEDPRTALFFEFKRGGAFIVTMVLKLPDGTKRKAEKGTYTVKGRTLTTRATRTETMTFKIAGGTLTLSKATDDVQIVLKRVKRVE